MMWYRFFYYAFIVVSPEDDFGIKLQTLSAPTKCIILCTVFILRLIYSYMFRRNRRLQGAYTNVVKTYSNKTVRNNDICQIF